MIRDLFTFNFSFVLFQSAFGCTADSEGKGGDKETKERRNVEKLVRAAESKCLVEPVRTIGEDTF